MVCAGGRVVSPAPTIGPNDLHRLALCAERRGLDK
jgi:hypothetical protein